MKYALIAGRLLFSLIFILSAGGHFKAATIGFAEMKGVPMAAVLVPLSGVIELIGGLSTLIGYRAKAGAWLLVLFLIPVTFTFHQFWAIQEPMARQMEMVLFLKNMSMLGGALILAYFGTGELSVDGLIKQRLSAKRAIA